MHRRGHYGMALLLSAPVAAGLAFGMGNAALGIPFTVLAVSTSMIPDIDQNLPLIRHRSVTHTIVFGVIVSLIGGLAVLLAVSVFLELTVEAFIVVFAYTFFAILAGLVSHLLADALTVGRGQYAIQPFWPLSYRELRFGLTRSDSLVWNNGLLLLGLLIQLSLFIAVR